MHHAFAAKSPHLPDHHILIEKRETAGRTRTLVRALTAAEQTEEIARMLSGATLTETSRQHAEQLLKANGVNGRLPKSPELPKSRKIQKETDDRSIHNLL